MRAGDTIREPSWWKFRARGYEKLVAKLPPVFIVNRYSHMSNHTIGALRST